jgi:fibronectin type 3 domain-containing protein
MKRKNHGYCTTLWLAVHVCLFTACAKVGDPVPPPPITFPDTTNDLTAQQEDTFPPSVPKNLTTLIVKGKVQLAWDNNNEKDLKGYFVYRGTEPSHLEKSSPLITINTHMVWDSFNTPNKATTAGQTVYYRVTAADHTGNESPQSEMVNITVR